MERIWTSEIGERAGERVRIAGWLHRLRRLGGLGFLVVRDGAGTAQVVVEDPALLETLAGLPSESVLAVEGRAVTAAQAPGGVEIREPAVEVLAPAAEPPPFDLFRPVLRAQLPTLLDHAALSLRHARRRALWALAASATEGFRSALRARRFVEIHTPKIVGAATESGANVFPIDYFGRRAYLAQSPQLYKQVMVGVFERVFEVGPVFRAEPHDTTRHVNEYTSLDAEMGFVDAHETVMGVLTLAVRGMLDEVAVRCGEAMAALRAAPPELPERIPAIHFADAQALLVGKTPDPVEGELDLAPSHEAWLGEWAKREHASDFLFVTGYPMAKRPFYTHPDPARPAFSNSFDLLFRGLEIATGGQRLHRHADYVEALAGRGIDPEPLAGYLEAFEHGMPPHGGFAIGLERFVARLAGVANVREVALFPRDIHRLTP